ncbi:hypothetical protein SCRES1_gp66 [Synechococcus phage S-CRES1]|nr:hypothetical protein SCRES1_gp66 [Synechococcus phage S-CRES1]
MPIMALDTSGVYTAGDDYRVIKVLSLPFGEYTLECVSNCMNQLEVMSVVAAQDLVTMLAAWDTADSAQTTESLNQTDGKKVLIKADVLEWEVTGGGMTGPQSEKLKIEQDIAELMAFCSCLGGFLSNSAYGSTSLIRS